MSKLTARRVETAGPGRQVDGKGLMLVVKPSGARSWVLRYQIAFRRRDMGLGSWPEVSLAEARRLALEARRLILEGKDPVDERKRRKATGMTFKAAAEALIEAKRPGWRSAKHAGQWTATLEAYVYPTLGATGTAGIETADVLRVLQPIWAEKPETASRVRQRIEAVLDYARVQGAVEGANPARWKGHLDHLLPKPGKVRAVEHHAAIDWRKIPAVWQALAEKQGNAARALAFIILTAARSSEVRGMAWLEIDLEARAWTVPAGRIKAGREHRVPLSEAALALLGTPDAPGALVFPSEMKHTAGKPLSDVAVTKVLRRLGEAEATVHGMRSSFRDWAGETTAFPREVIEAALAHQIKDKAEAAYARGDLFDKRRKLMEAWAGYLAKAGENVVPMRGWKS